MADVDEPFANPETGKERIFRATYEVIRDRGYADVSIQRIADQASVSKSTIYHHFDDKDALLVAFARRLLSWYIDLMLFDPEADLVENLERSLDLVFLGETKGGLTLDEFRPPGLDAVYLDMRAQAIRNPDVRAHFDETDTLVRERLAAFVEAGIENGTFRAVDPDEVAATLYVFIEGALLLRTTGRNADWLRHARTAVDDYIADLQR